MTLDILNKCGVPAYRDTPPVACRSEGGHCANTSIGAVDYIAGADSCAAMGTNTPQANNAVMYAVPFVSPPFDCGINRLAFEVTTSQVGTQAFIGLFEDVDFYYSQPQGDALKPGKILHNSGAIATTSNALMTSTVTGVRLKPNRWYWLVYYVGIETTHATIRSISAGAGTRSIGALASVGNQLNTCLSMQIATSQFENWGTSPELTGTAWTPNTIFPVLRYRLTT